MVSFSGTCASNNPFQQGRKAPFLFRKLPKNECKRFRFKFELIEMKSNSDQKNTPFSNVVK